MVSKFGIFEGFRWVLSLILVDEPVIRNVRSSVFLDFGPGLAHFEPNRFEVEAFLRGSKFIFGGRTWVQVSSKFDLSGLKIFIFVFDPKLDLSDEASVIFFRSDNMTCTKYLVEECILKLDYLKYSITDNSINKRWIVDRF